MDTCTHGWMDEWKNEWMSTCEGCTGYQFQPKGDNAEWYGAAAKSLQSCPTLWDPIDSSPPGSPVPEIHQARTLEWVAISFSNGWKWKVKVKSLSRVRLLATPWTAAHQAPLSMGFSRQGYWSGVPLPSPGSVLVNGKWWFLFYANMFFSMLTSKMLFFRVFKIPSSSSLSNST